MFFKKKKKKSVWDKCREIETETNNELERFYREFSDRVISTYGKEESKRYLEKKKKIIESLKFKYHELDFYIVCDGDRYDAVNVGREKSASKVKEAKELINRYIKNEPRYFETMKKSAENWTKVAKHDGTMFLIVKKIPTPLDYDFGNNVYYYANYTRYVMNVENFLQDKYGQYNSVGFLYTDIPNGNFKSVQRFGFSPEVYIVREMTAEEFNKEYLPGRMINAEIKNEEDVLPFKNTLTSMFKQYGQQGII